MIGKASTGGSFRGLSNYLESEEKLEWKETQNLPGINRNQDIRLMEDTASMSKAEKPVYHLSVSYADGDNPSKQQMMADGKATLEKLGLGDKQAVFVAHKDTDHPHLHIMANRVDMETGKAQSMWKDRNKIRTQMRAIETERGYEQTRLHDPEKALELTNGEYHQLQERAQMPLKAKAQFYDFQGMFDQAQSWGELQTALNEVQCGIERKGRGGVVKDYHTDKTLKLSRIDSNRGRNQSFGRLEKRLGKAKEYNKSIEKAQQIKKALPDQKIGQATARIVKEGWGGQTISRGAKKQFRKAIKRSYRAGKNIAKLGSIGASGGAAAPMSYALKAGKGIIKQLNQDRGRGRGMEL